MTCDYCKKEANVGKHSISVGETYFLHRECFDKLDCKDCGLLRWCDKSKHKKCGDFELIQ